MSGLLRTYARRAARDDGKMGSLKRVGQDKTGNRPRKILKVRARAVPVPRDWRCVCGKVVKKTIRRRAIQWAGFQTCVTCFNLKAPEIFEKKEWGKVPKFR